MIKPESNDSALKYVPYKFKPDPNSFAHQLELQSFIQFLITGVHLCVFETRIPCVSMDLFLAFLLSS